MTYQTDQKNSLLVTKYNRYFKDTSYSSVVVQLYRGAVFFASDAYRQGCGQMPGLKEFFSPLSHLCPLKVVCIEISRGFNARNAELSSTAGLSDKIIIPGERFMSCEYREVPVSAGTMRPPKNVQNLNGYRQV